MDAILCSEAEKQARARKKGCDKPPINPYQSRNQSKKRRKESSALFQAENTHIVRQNTARCFFCPPLRMNGRSYNGFLLAVIDQQGNRFTFRKHMNRRGNNGISADGKGFFQQLTPPDFVNVKIGFVRHAFPRNNLPFRRVNYKIHPSSAETETGE